VNVSPSPEQAYSDVVPRKEHEKLLAQLDQSQQEIAHLEQQLAELKRLIFGSKSERFVATSSEQLALFEGLERQLEAKKQRQAANTNNTLAKQKPVRNLLPAHLPRQEEIIEPDDVPPGAKKIGEEITEVLEYSPARLFVRRIIRPKYALKEDQGDGLSVSKSVVIGELPSLPIPKGNAAASLLAHIQVSKYVDHLPYYRQIQMLKRSGVELSDSTINGWFNATADLLEPLYDCLCNKVLACDYLQADESPIKVLDSHKNRATHTGYHWVYHAPLERMVLFDYQSSRSREGPEQLLEHFNGILQTDGYTAYNSLKTKGHIILTACMAHARRYFEKALDNDKPRAEHALNLIAQLYAIERKAKDLTARERYDLRQKQAKPILDELEAWLKENQHRTTPKSPIGKAISYTINLWTRIRRYTDDGGLLIDNNRIENAIRPLALGRKNYLFAGNHAAAQRAAMMYSFFATCKVNQVEPYLWLKNTLERIPEHKANRLTELLPISKM